ncbi:MAG TPA: hypothetical protein VHO70_05705 [Chitinispirillaceae bacterium]|nr:hypothetical protein [Chitinispirillaceae bacterium]
MAYLILNDERVYADDWEPTEKCYEFDPSDEDSLDRIHRILSLRTRGIIQNSETVLADICETTTTHTQIVNAKPLARRLLEHAIKFLSSNSNSRKKIHHKQSSAVYSCKYFSAQSSLQ